MRIALRPSGGRGDYELAGSYNRLHASDLLEKNFVFQVTPSLAIDGMAKAHRLAGKTRIRPEGGRHAYIIISSLLLLPPPRRELLRTPNSPPQLRTRAYTVAGIDVDVLADERSRVIFAPKSIWARSRGGLLKVDFAERIAIILTLWSVAESKRSDVAVLVKEHGASITADDHDRIVKSAASIQQYYRTTSDVVPFLLRDFGLSSVPSEVFTGISTETTGFETEEDASSPEASQRERKIKWRRQIDRGPGAREFSVRIRRVYDFRCLFSGERFPRLPFLDSSGVDGAHILPWSSHRLNSLSNGICLCKLCHWAFDNGLFQLNFDEASNDYLVSIPREIQKAAVSARFDILPFQRIVGRIDPSRLPRNRRLWPSPENIRELNASV